MKKYQHIVPLKNGWAVKSEGEENYTSIHKTQDEAVDAARKIAKKERSEIIIHNKSVLPGSSVENRNDASSKRDSVH